MVWETVQVTYPSSREQSIVEDASRENQYTEHPAPRTDVHATP